MLVVLLPLLLAVYAHGAALAADASPSKPDTQVLLDDGIESYENGAYGNAIRKLGEIVADPGVNDAMRVKALKYLAFSYCVSPSANAADRARRLSLCRQAFARALALDPTFDLAPGERAHPIWGREFDAARNSSAGSRASAPSANMPPGRH